MIILLENSLAATPSLQVCDCSARSLIAARTMMFINLPIPISPCVRTSTTVFGPFNSGAERVYFIIKKRHQWWIQTGGANPEGGNNHLFTAKLSPKSA